MPKKIKAAKKEKNIFAGVGYSRVDDPYKAGYEAAKMAMDDMQKEGGQKPTFGLVFCSGIKYGKNDNDVQRFVDGAQSVFKGMPWIGGTSCGGVIAVDKLLEGSCVACVVSSEYLQVGIGIGADVHKTPKEAGEKAAKEAITNLKREKIVVPYLRYLAEKRKTSAELMKQYPYFLLLISNGHTLDEIGKEELVLDGVFEIVGKQIPVIGGTTGQENLMKNYQFCNGKAYSNATIALAVSTGLKVGFGYSHGYVPTGESCIVTDSKYNIVNSLNKKPAAEVYASLLNMKLDELWTKKTEMMMKMTPFAKLAIKYFSSDLNPKSVPFATIAVSNPMGIMDMHGDITVRVARSIKGDSIEFYEKIPQGMVLNKLKVDPKLVLDSEINAVKNAVEDSGANEPDIIFIFDCALRRIFLMEEDKTSDFIKFLKDKYPRAKLVGFNSMGEFAFNRKSEPMATAASVSVGVVSGNLVTE